MFGPRSSFPRVQESSDADHHTEVVCSLWLYMMAGRVARVAPWRGVCQRPTQNKITGTTWAWRERGGTEEGTCIVRKARFDTPARPFAGLRPLAYVSVGTVYRVRRSPGGFLQMPTFL
eukprot:8343088-Lingulodinium_polyedra.AAC.1